MTGLARFVMRGRFQALLVAVAGAGSLLFCWISAAVVALVTLRKGPAAGGWLLAWALLPALAVAYAYGDGGPLSLLVGTAALAMVLRTTVNLPLALLGSVAVGAVTGLSLLALAGGYLEQVVAVFGDFLASLEQQMSSEGQAVTLQAPTVTQVAGMLGAGTAMSAVLCLLLARYWQAALYNPGGFGAEFRALRYPPQVSIALLVAALALAGLEVEYRTWAVIGAIPLTFAGLALVHAHFARRGRGRGWIAAFYVGWILFDPVKLVVVAAAVIDSFADFRRRWAGRNDVRR